MRRACGVVVWGPARRGLAHVSSFERSVSERFRRVDRARPAHSSLASGAANPPRRALPPSPPRRGERSDAGGPADSALARVARSARDSQRRCGRSELCGAEDSSRRSTVRAPVRRRPLAPRARPVPPGWREAKPGSERFSPPSPRVAATRFAHGDSGVPPRREPAFRPAPAAYPPLSAPPRRGSPPARFPPLRLRPFRSAPSASPRAAPRSPLAIVPRGTAASRAASPQRVEAAFKACDDARRLLDAGRPASVASRAARPRPRHPPPLPPRLPASPPFGPGASGPPVPRGRRSRLHFSTERHGGRHRADGLPE